MQIVVGWNRLMIAVGVVSTMACASGVLGAQTIPSTSSSTAWVGGGLGVQNDASVSAGVQLSPIGALAALGFSHTLSSGYDFGVRASASFYPQTQENRVTLVGPSAEGVDPDGNLTVGIVAAELGPHRARGASWFGTAGAAFALATPRRYDRVAPMLGAGVIAPMTEHTAARVSFEWMARALGRTRFQIPLIVSYTTPF